MLVGQSVGLSVTLSVGRSVSQSGVGRLVDVGRSVDQTFGQSVSWWVGLLIGQVVVVSRLIASLGRLISLSFSRSVGQRVDTFIVMFVIIVSCLQYARFS